MKIKVKQEKGIMIGCEDDPFEKCFVILLIK